VLSAERVSVAIFAAAVLVSVGDIPVWVNTYKENVKAVQWLNIRMADYILEHVPPTAAVAANDIGAIAYFGSHRVVDLMGIVNPELYERTSRLGLRPFTRNYVRYVAGYLLEQTDVWYAAVFPDWFPFEELYPDAFVPVHEEHGPSIDAPELELVKKLYFIDRNKLREYFKPK